MVAQKSTLKSVLFLFIIVDLILKIVYNYVQYIIWRIIMKLKNIALTMLLPFSLSGCILPNDPSENKESYCDDVIVKVANRFFDMKEKGTTKEDQLKFLNERLDIAHKFVNVKGDNKEIIPPLDIQIKTIHELLYESNYEKYDFENKIRKNCIFYNWESSSYKYYQGFSVSILGK